MGIFQGAGSIALSHQMLKGSMTQKKVKAEVAGSQYSQPPAEPPPWQTRSLPAAVSLLFPVT